MRPPGFVLSPTPNTDLLCWNTDSSSPNSSWSWLQTNYAAEESTLFPKPKQVLCTSSIQTGSYVLILCLSQSPQFGKQNELIPFHEWFSSFCRHGSPGEPVKTQITDPTPRVSDSAGLRWDMRISDKFTGGGWCCWSKDSALRNKNRGPCRGRGAMPSFGMTGPLESIVTTNKSRWAHLNI